VVSTLALALNLLVSNVEAPTKWDQFVTRFFCLICIYLKRLKKTEMLKWVSATWLLFEVIFWNTVLRQTWPFNELIATEEEL
jgi:hypothetical protein